MAIPKKRQLTAVLIIGMAFLAFIFALHGSLLTRMIEFYGLTDSSQGMPSAAASAGGFIALVSSLFLNGRLSKLTLLKFSIGICTLFLFLLPRVSDFPIFIIIWIFIGIGLGYIDTLLSSCMADFYCGKMVRRMMCFLHLTYGLAYIAAPIVYSFSLRHMEKNRMSWHKLYAFLAGAGLLLLVFLLFAARDIAQDKNSIVSLEDRLSLSLVSELVHIKRGILPHMMLAMFCHGIFLSGISTWINRYVEQTLQAHFGAYALSFLFLGVMISRLLMSFLKISSEYYVSVAGFAACGIVLVTLPFGNAGLMCAAFCFGGLFFGAMIPCILTICSFYAPDNSMLVTTFMMLAYYLGQAIGPTLVGMLESRFNLQTGIGVCSIFIALTSVCCWNTGS